MLKHIRNSKIGIILAIVFGISLFLIRGGNRYSGIMGVGANDIAVVGDVNITNVQFLRTYDLNKKKFIELTGSELTNDQSKQLGLDQQSLAILINEAILKNEFNKMSMYLDDETIAKFIKNLIPSIYDQNNKLNENNLNSFLFNQNLDLTSFIDIISTQILRDTYENSLFNNIYYPEKLIKNIDKINNHKRNIEYLIIPEEKIKKEIIRDEDSIKKFYENNIKLYQEPEKRTIDYVILDPKDFTNMYDFNNSQIKEYFDDNEDLFTIEEKRSFIQLNFQEKIDAENFKILTNNISTYKEIKELAEKNKIRFIEFNMVENNEILEEISKVVFNTSKNEISEIIASPLAFHIVFVKDLTPKQKLSADISKEKIINNLKNESAVNYVQELLEKIDEDIINNNNLIDISNQYNLKVKNLFEISQKDNFQGIEKLIINKAFKEEINFISSINNGILKNTYFIFNVSNIIEPTIKDYEIAKLDVYEDWKDFEKERNAKDYINEELKNYDKNSSLVKKLSNIHKLKIENIEISHKNDDLPIDFINKIFNSKVGDPVYYYYNSNIYLGATESINIPNSSDDLYKEKTRINNNISKEIKNNFTKSLSNKIKIRINHDLLDMLTSNI